MKFESALSFFNDAEYIFDMGQLDDKFKNYLKSEIKKRNVIKEKAFWPWITRGTVKKTIYRKIK